MEENNIKSIVFPAMNAAGEAKTKGLVEKIADYMGAKVDFETVIVMKVNYPGDRQDIGMILNRLAGKKTGLTSPKQNSSAESTVE